MKIPTFLTLIQIFPVSVRRKALTIYIIYNNHFMTADNVPKRHKFENHVPSEPILAKLLPTQ